MKNNSENTFLRLVYALRELKSFGNSTIILGAGCSLSSTSRDITTVGIMRQCLIEHGIEEKEVHTYPWETLYQNFINIVWEGKAEKERELLLKSKLDDIQPSVGHTYLRNLVEAGYIHNVITTNFDMLLENAFDGLSYNKRVGDGEYKIIGKDKPKFNLLKVHGDLNEGGFRFAPNELMKLPPNLHDDIFEKTSGLIIFIGYRGQDIGLMNAISNIKEFAVYWIDLNSIDTWDAFSTKHIIEFMRNRESTNNFLCGKEFGDFQKLLEHLYNLLIHPKHINVIQTKELNISKRWKKTTIIELLSIYDRIYEVFLDILNYSNKISFDLSIKSQIKYNQDYYDNLLYSYLYFFKSNQLPPEILHIPKNEVDALLLGVSIEILVQSTVCNVTCSSYIDLLSKRDTIYENDINKLDRSFWDTVTQITCHKTGTNQILKLKMKNRLVLENCDIPINNFSELIDTVKLLSQFIPNSINGEKNDNENYYLHKLIIESNKSIEMKNEKINITIGPLKENEIKKFYEAYLKKSFINIENNKIRIDKKDYIIFKTNWINFEIEIMNETLDDYSQVSYYSICKKRSIQSTKKFLELSNVFGLSIADFTVLTLDNDLKEFLSSRYPAMFIVGESGSGKTSALHRLVYVNKDNENIIPIVVSPKISTIEKEGLSLFLDMDIDDELLIFENINSSFKLRQQTLLLIFDGINELTQGRIIQQRHYCNLLSLAQIIYEKNYDAIKIIITCRRNAYFDYVDQTMLHLNTLYFYSNKEKTDNLDDSCYEVHQLNKHEKVNLINQYVDESKISNEILESIISMPTVTPFFIAIVGVTSNRIIDLNEFKSENAIYDLFAKTMLNRIDQNNIYLAKKIIYTYFDILLENESDSFEITKFNLVGRISIDYDKFALLIQDLTDVDIFLDTSFNNKVIKFYHDKIEEFFFKEYIEEFSYKGTNLFIKLFKLSKKSDIYKDGLLRYLILELENKNVNLYKSIFIQSFNKYIDEIIPKMLVESLSLSNNPKDKLLSIFNSEEDGIDKYIINLIQLGLENELKDYSHESYRLLEFINITIGIYEEKDIVDNNLAILYYFKSKLYYYLNNYKKAKYYADISLESVTNAEHLLLTQIQIQHAIIDMELGYSKKCIAILEEEIKNCDIHNNQTKFIDISIELGRALNHSGQISRTLDIYDTITKCSISNPYILSRLYEQKANVLNRIMFIKLENGLVKKDELSVEELSIINQLFKEAVSLYNQSIEILLSVNAIWSYTGVVPELILTYITYSFSIKEIGIKKCEEYVEDANKLFLNFTTPFKTDFYIAIAYYYEYLGNLNKSEESIKIAILNSQKLGIKAKEAKSRDFYSNFIYRQIVRNIKKYKSKEMIDIAIYNIDNSLEYYYKNTIIENNVLIKSDEVLKKSLLIIKNDIF